jgi:hypothetical protein
LGLEDRRTSQTACRGVSVFFIFLLRTAENAPAEIREVFNTVVSSNLRWLTTKLDEIYLLMEAEKNTECAKKEAKDESFGSSCHIFQRAGQRGSLQ